MNSDLAGKKVQLEVSLVDLAQKGNLEAFNQLVTSYQGQVFQLALWIMKDEFQADDVTQNTFISAFLKIKQFRGGSFRAWLMRIASNACYDELRRQKRHPILPLSSENHTEDEQDLFRWLTDMEPSVEQHVEQNEFRRYLHKCIEELPVMYRLPIIFIDLQDMSYEESSRAIGVPLGTLKSRLSRARILLQERIRESSVYQHETNRFYPAVHKKVNPVTWVTSS